MGRLFYHLSKGAGESGSPFAIILVILLAIAYFVYKNWDRISESDFIASAKTDLSKPGFTPLDLNKINRVHDFYIRLVAYKVIKEIDGFNYYYEIAHNNFYSLSVRILDEFADAFKLFSDVLLYLSEELINNRRSQEALQFSKMGKEAAECYAIISTRATQLFEHNKSEASDNSKNQS